MKARRTGILPLLVLGLGVLLCAGLLPFDAFANGLANDWDKCSGSGVSKIFCGITQQFRFMPRLLSIFAYVMAVVLAVQGFLQLRDYGDDPTKVPLPSILIKFALAAALISLPLTMQLFVTSVTGAKSITATSQLTNKPSFGKGAGGN